jgi:hypothetical protein
MAWTGESVLCASVYLLPRFSAGPTSPALSQGVLNSGALVSGGLSLEAWRNGDCLSVMS